VSLGARRASSSGHSAHGRSALAPPAPNGVAPVRHRERNAPAGCTVGSGEAPSRARAPVRRRWVRTARLAIVSRQRRTHRAQANRVLRPSTQRTTNRPSRKSVTVLLWSLARTAGQRARVAGSGSDARTRRNRGPAVGTAGSIGRLGQQHQAPRRATPGAAYEGFMAVRPWSISFGKLIAELDRVVLAARSHLLARDRSGRGSTTTLRRSRTVQWNKQRRRTPRSEEIPPHCRSCPRKEESCGEPGSYSSRWSWS
jgi:hypothetical protein